MTSFFLFLNSKDVSIGTSSNFQVDFEQSGINFSDAEIAIGVDYVIFPNLIYPIRSGRNQLVINEGGGNLTATIAEGNYDITTFPTALKTALDAAGADTYTVTISSSTYKITISSTGTFSMKFSSTSTSGDMWKILGFAYNTDTSTTASHTGTMPIRLDGDEYYCLMIDNLPSTNISSSFSTRGIMDIIPMNNAFGDIIYYTPNQKNNFVLTNTENLKYLRIRITDQWGYDIPLPDNCEVLIKLRVICSQHPYVGQT